MTSFVQPATRIVIFAKAPIPGFCKTRLMAALGSQGAAALAEQMLLHTLSVAKQSSLGPVELCVTPGPLHPQWQSVMAKAHAMTPANETGIFQGVVWSEQSEGDLGQRMANAVQRTLVREENIICIGTDCPELTVTHLQHAAAALQHQQAAIAPALDGGYVLLALREFDSRLFTNIVWSTSTVCAQTLERIHTLGWRIVSLPTLRDIDEPDDLPFLPLAFNDLMKNISSTGKSNL